jgi:hypothetical protein
VTTVPAATAVAVLLAALALAALAVLTVVPWSVAVTLAERRGLGTARWSLLGGACCLLGLGVAGSAALAGRPAVAVLGLPVSWAAPLALALLGPAGTRWAGVRGRHE